MDNRVLHKIFKKCEYEDRITVNRSLAPKYRYHRKIPKKEKKKIKEILREALSIWFTSS